MVFMAEVGLDCSLLHLRVIYKDEFQVTEQLAVPRSSIPRKIGAGRCSVCMSTVRRHGRHERSLGGKQQFCEHMKAQYPEESSLL